MTRRVARLRSKLTPARILQALAIFVVGSLIGVSMFTFIYAKGYSYLGSDPSACVNCHAMNSQYEAWMKGPHHGVATCNDCHTPHDSIIHKYYVKADDGLRHGFKFTTGWYPENIQITDANLKIANEACLYCHSDMTHDIRMTAPDEQLQCTRCHSDVGHANR